MIGMRIVAGLYGGRKLSVPKNRDIRPTSDKIRGAVFNMLVSRGMVDGAIVLDAFCGTGALGLEALSRGAVHCTFMDKARESLQLAQDNAHAFGVAGQVEFILKDSTKLSSFKPEQLPYTLVFLDPPYHKNMVTQALEALHKGGVLSANCLIVCETEKGADIRFGSDFRTEFSKTYGSIDIICLSYNPAV